MEVGGRLREETEMQGRGHCSTQAEDQLISGHGNTEEDGSENISFW